MSDVRMGLLAGTLVVGAPLYLLLAFYPAEIGRWLAARLRGGREPASLWDLGEIVDRRRRLVRRVLLGLIVLAAGLAAGLLALARERAFPHMPLHWLVVAVLALFSVAVALARLRSGGPVRVPLAGIQDRALIGRARAAVGGVAIAAGIAPPGIEVVGHPRPTAFTVPRGGEPVVVFTTGLLTALSPGEVEAVAAHESGHIVSRFVDEGQTVEFLLDVLRLLGVAALWIYLLSRPSVFTLIVLGAMLVVIVAGVRVLFDPVMDQVGLLSGRVVDAFVMMLNPPLVLVNILAQTLYALVGQDEDLLADLRAVEFTRHPDALHAALRRVRAAAPSGPPLPLAYHMRYFTAEGVLPVGFPAAQPPVEQRLRVLERVDPSLAATRVLRPRILECPDCGEPLAGRSVASHYGAPIPIDACEACGGIWFDDLELYMTGSQELLAGRAGTPARPAPGGPRRCPRCRVALERASTFGIPDEIAIWECGVCRGAWVGPDDLVRFGRFRDARRRSATASTRRAD